MFPEQEGDRTTTGNFQIIKFTDYWPLKYESLKCLFGSVL